MDVAVNGKTVLTNVPYGTASGYLTVKSGARQIEVRATGTTQDAINVKPTLGGKKDYTVLAEDFLANIAASALTDDNSAPDSGKVKVRVVHGSPSAAIRKLNLCPPATWPLRIAREKDGPGSRCL